MGDSVYRNISGNMKMVGVVFGTFEPLHLEHLKHLERCAAQVDELMILVSDLRGYRRQAPYDPLSNSASPFSYKDRRNMIENALVREAGMSMSSFSVHPMLRHLMDMRGDGPDPNFYLIARHGRLTWPVKKAFQRVGKSVGIFGGEYPVQQSTAEVRALMRSGGNWQELVPRSTVEVVNKNGGLALA